MQIHSFRVDASALQRSDWKWEQVEAKFGEPPFPAVAKHAATLWGRWEARRRIMRVGVHVLQAHLKNGTLPKNLPDIGPDSIDPFSGKRLGYKPTGDTFMLYSVGPDRRDDGGVRKTYGSKGYNLVFKF